MRTVRNRLAIGLVAVVLAITGLVSATPAQSAPAPIRAAFYYPWYPETWNDGTRYHPSMGRYDSASVAVIQAHIYEMAYAGIQAGIASWWGRGTPTDSRFPALLQGAAGTSFKWTGYYEPEGYSDPSVSAIGSDLAYLGNYASNPGWLRVNGKPVLFVYAAGNDGCGMVDRWTQANAGRFYLVLKVFGGYRSCPSQPDSWHQYAPAVAVDQQGTYSYSVSPGFYKANQDTPRLVRDPARFAANVAAMNASGAQWQLITTFNEWGEGTAIEPADEWGSQWLDILRGGVTVTPSPTSTPPPTTPPVTTPPPTSPPPTSPPPSTKPLVVIYMENHERSSIVGSSSAPYMNNIRSLGTDFTAYFGVTHPSLPNYLALANGSTDGKQGSDSIRAGELPQSPTVWNQLTAAGVSWRVYEESMPSACYSGSSSGGYALKHNPATPFAAVFNDKALCANVQPYTKGVPLASVNFIAPNLCNDMHDCSIATGDSWLASNVPPMLAAGATVVVTFDEGSSSTAGGGNVYTVVIRNGITHTVNTTTYNHYSLLRAIEDRYGLARLGAAASASPLPL